MCERYFFFFLLFIYPLTSITSYRKYTNSVVPCPRIFIFHFLHLHLARIVVSLPVQILKSSIMTWKMNVYGICVRGASKRYTGTGTLFGIDCWFWVLGHINIEHAHAHYRLLVVYSGHSKRSQLAFSTCFVFLSFDYDV